MIFNENLTKYHVLFVKQNLKLSPAANYRVNVIRNQCEIRPNDNHHLLARIQWRRGGGEQGV